MYKGEFACVQSGSLVAKLSTREGSEMDFVVIAIAVAFFVISGVVVGLLDRL